MDDFNNACQWVDRTRFECCNQKDGLLLFLNMKLATAFPNFPSRLNERPKVFKASEIKRELGEKVFTMMQPKKDTNASKRVFSSVKSMTKGDIVSKRMMDEVFEKMELMPNEESYDKLSNHVPIDEYDDNHGYCVIDLNIHDDFIMDVFKRWLAQTRKEKGECMPKPYRNEAERINDAKLLPYLWLCSWMKANNVKLTHAQIGFILFGDGGESGANTGKKFETITKKYFDRYVLADSWILKEEATIIYTLG